MSVASTPRVSVLMPVRNGGPFLTAAMASIQRQTMTDWEMLVVDDGSDDDSLNRVEDAMTEDGRIRLIRQDRLGLVASLNRAVAEARGDYLARMDADDLARPGRLKQQVDYLGTHPQVGVLGGAIRLFGAQRGVWRFPCEDERLKASLLFTTPFAHPTVMMRTAVIRQAGEGYREEFRAAEDVDLWARIAPVVKFANLPMVLLDYRVHPGQVTERDRPRMSANGAKVRSRILRDCGMDVCLEEEIMHENLVGGHPGSLGDLVRTGQWLERVSEACGEKIAPVRKLHQEVGMRWADFCSLHRNAGLAAWKIFRASPLAYNGLISKRRRARLLVACLLGGSRD